MNFTVAKFYRNNFDATSTNSQSNEKYDEPNIKVNEGNEEIDEEKSFYENMYAENNLSPILEENDDLV